MKHSMIKKTGYLLTAVLFLFCCTSEKESFWHDVEKEEIQSFFKFESSQSRTESFTTDLIQVVINTLCKQGDLLDAVRTYRSKYGIPMWEHSVGISVENGYRLFVPIYNENNKDEINLIWNFKIFKKKLYNFTSKRNPASNIVAEYWKFDYFTIYALGKKPKSGLSFEHVKSRSDQNCVNASVTVGEGEYAHTEYMEQHCWSTDDDSESAYADMESDDGSGFPSEIPIEDSGGGGNSGSTGSGGDSNDDTSDSDAAPKAQAIFRNSNMTEQNWGIIERMLDKIIATCMGENLYNALKEKLNGNTLTIQFQNDKGSSFNYQTGAIKLSAINMESNHLMHEMFHAYQAYQETQESYKNSRLNLEIEAHYAQYLYLKKLPEYPGSKWHGAYVIDDRHRSISELEWYINSKGELYDYSTTGMLDTHIEEVVGYFHEIKEYEGFKFDENQKGLSIFENLNVLTKDC